MRMLALDVGEKRIGVAVSDEAGKVALPVDTVVRGESLENDLVQIAEIAQSRGAQRIVIGLPTSLKGQPGPAAQQMTAFAAALRQATPVEVVLWDERLTTVIAERAIRMAGVRRSQRRQHIDQVAAALILQSYLERNPDDLSA